MGPEQVVAPHAGFVCHPAHAHAGSDGVAVRPGGESSDDLAVSQNRLVVEQKRFGIIEAELDEAAPDALFTVTVERSLAYEAAGLVPCHREPQTRFERRVLVGDVVAPMPVSLLEP